MDLFDLRCEYRSNPLGPDVSQPRLSSKLATDRRDKRQAACQMLVASSREALAAGRRDLWDSGRAESAVPAHVPFAGEPLVSRQGLVEGARVGRDRPAHPI